MAKRIRQRRIDADILAAIDDKEARGLGGAAIQRALEADPQFEGKALPSLRTIQGIVRDLGPRDSSALWRLEDAHPDDAKILLPVLAVVIYQTEGARGLGARALTVGLSEWIVRLSRAGASDLDLWGLFRLARHYLRRQSDKQSTADLDAFVAFAPWRNAKGWEYFAFAVDQGWVELYPGMSKMELAGLFSAQLATAELVKVLVEEEQLSQEDASALGGDFAGLPPAVQEAIGRHADRIVHAIRKGAKK